MMENTGKGRRDGQEAHAEVTTTYRPGGEEGMNQESIWQVQRP